MRESTYLNGIPYLGDPELQQALSFIQNQVNTNPAVSVLWNTDPQRVFAAAGFNDDIQREGVFAKGTASYSCTFTCLTTCWFTQIGPLDF